MKKIIYFLIPFFLTILLDISFNYKSETRKLHNEIVEFTFKKCMESQQEFFQNKKIKIEKKIGSRHCKCIKDSILNIEFNNVYSLGKIIGTDFHKTFINKQIKLFLTSLQMKEISESCLSKL